MKFFSNLSIGTKIVSFISMIVTLGIVSLVLIISMSLSETMKNNAEAVITNASTRNADFVESAFGESSSLLSASAQNLEDILGLISYGDIDPTIFEDTLTNALDNISYATYGYIYLTNPPSNFRAKNSKFTSENGEFVMLYKDDIGEVMNMSSSQKSNFTKSYQDGDLKKFGGMKLLKASSSIPALSSVQKALKSTYGKDLVIFGEPKSINIGGNFVGINIAAPIFDKSKKVIGVIGFIIDSKILSSYLLDPEKKNFAGEDKMLVTNSGVITVHTNSNIVLKNYYELNSSPQVQKVYDTIKNAQDRVFDDYKT
ncbi:PDC sensor domain-containing protein, partial [Helicobacter sp. T3_23-1059]